VIVVKNKTTVSLFFMMIMLVVLAVSARTFVFNVLSGRVSFPEEYSGAYLKMEDGQAFRVFRRVKVDGRGDSFDDLAVFRVRFQFKNLSNSANRRLSVIPAPFLMGMKGFREKCWTIDEDANLFQGIYQWSSREAAEGYPDTFIFRVMTKRAAPGTVSYAIIPNTEISAYLRAHAKIASHF
jgi:hypothetical protein